MRRLATALLLATALGTSGCRRDELPERVTGAGSTFVHPLMIRWLAEYRRATDEDIGYQSLGSTGGIIWMTERKADFGCTDAPMTDEQLAKAHKAGGEVIHVPLVLGAVVPVYHVPGLAQPLRFSGPLLADIYLGKVKRWNDPALGKLNPGAPLPDLEIIVVRRTDGSGTTFIWTDYLSKVSPQWKAKVGASQLPAWPVGVRHLGNEGVAEHVRKTPGSIGYVELAYVPQMDLTAGLVQNREGEFVKANVDSIRAAADAALVDIPADLRFALTDPPGKGSFPVCGATWAVLFVNQPAGRGQKCVDFLHWAVGDGQQYARELLYAPLSDRMRERAATQLGRVRIGT